MTTVTHSYNQTGSPDGEDQLTRIFLIDLENARRTAFNSTVPPPVTPLAILSKSNPAERKASVEVIINAIVPNWWRSYVEQAKAKETDSATFREVKDAYANATPERRIAGLNAMKGIA